MIILRKKEVKRLCKGLSNREFACKCSYPHCQMTLVSKALIKAYDNFRSLVGVRLIINSGYRCPQHNFDSQGKPCSQHQAGRAIDISRKSISHLSEEEIDHALKLSGFTFTKFYKTFIHADVR